MHPSMAHQQYQCYATGAGYPLHVPPEMICLGADHSLQGHKQIRPAGSEAETYYNRWVGRTKAQVDEDNVKLALSENVWKYDAMKPKDARPEQLFWVIELDQKTTLRSFKTIENDLAPGKWERDQRFGNAYFVREDPPKDNK